MLPKKNDFLVEGHKSGAISNIYNIVTKKKHFFVEAREKNRWP